MAVDFEAIWHTHKRFILQVAGGALAFSVLLGWRGSIAAEATRMAKANAGQQAELQDDLGGLLGAEGLEKGRAAALGERLEPAVLDALLWRPDEGFVLPKGEKSGLMYYSDVASRAAKAVADKAAESNAQVPTTTQALGLVTEPEEARVPEALAQVDLVRRLVLRLLAAGVRNVSRVELLDATYQAREGGYLRQLPARLTFRARSETLARALGELQVAGSFVEVLGCRVTRERGAGEPLLVELEVQALATVEQAPVAPVSAGAAAGSRRGPRRFGRER